MAIDLLKFMGVLGAVAAGIGLLLGYGIVDAVGGGMLFAVFFTAIGVAAMWVDSLGRKT